jgi:hypothetical protein
MIILRLIVILRVQVTYLVAFLIRYQVLHIYLVGMSAVHKLTIFKISLLIQLNVISITRHLRHKFVGHNLLVANRISQIVPIVLRGIY